MIFVTLVMMFLRITWQDFVAKIRILNYGALLGRHTIIQETKVDSNRASNVDIDKYIMIQTEMVSIFKESQIKIGDNTILRSRSRGNAIGVNHRIVITTLSSNACIEIGNDVGMSGGAICCKQRIIIGDHTLLGANTIIADNDMHPVESDSRRNNNGNADILAKEVNIGKNV